MKASIEVEGEIVMDGTIVDAFVSVVHFSSIHSNFAGDNLNRHIYVGLTGQGGHYTGRFGRDGRITRVIT